MEKTTVRVGRRATVDYHKSPESAPTAGNRLLLGGSVVPQPCSLSRPLSLLCVFAFLTSGFSAAPHRRCCRCSAPAPATSIKPSDDARA
uniref:Uncharacterized protein n=1 Tax=Plectus sambesii TaxID=2011161 RepID=A0A914WRV2_9BILA